MNLLFFTREDVASAPCGAVPGSLRVALSDERAQHLREVLRVALDDTVRVGVERGPTGSARVVALEGPRVTLDVVLDGPPSVPPPLHLVLALPRPKALSRVLQTIASLGVERLDLVNAWRVEKSYFASPRLTPERVAEELRLGCAQGRTTWVPEVRVVRLLSELFTELEEPTPETLRLLAHPHESAPIEAVVTRHAHQRVLLAIGPEGGFIADELARFTSLGFTPVSLDRAVLRVEVVVPVALGQLALLRRLARAPEAGEP